jgi:hypothetical protein
MELIWIVLSLLAIDVAALLFAVDTRPGFQPTAPFRDAPEPSPTSRP